MMVLVLICSNINWQIVAARESSWCYNMLSDVLEGGGASAKKSWRLGTPASAPTTAGRPECLERLVD